MSTTTKSHEVSNLNTKPNQIGRLKDDAPMLKNKITELERQVNDYKMKFDELRRAKATTVVKHEREYINANASGLNRPDKNKTCEKCEDFERILEAEKKSHLQLNKILEQKQNNKDEPHNASTINSRSCLNCSHYKQLLDIEKETYSHLTKQFQTRKKQTEQEQMAKQIFEKTIEIMKADITQETKLYEQLRHENKDLQNKSQLINNEHKKKMNDLLNKEEAVKKKIEIWEEMYQEWMATMERRVNNLQITDEEFQAYLHKKNDANQNP